jgi:hypothetical protein
VDTTRVTGVYPFTFLARNKYPGNSIRDSVLYDTLIVVNRTQSQYGAGWSLVGAERLYENQPAGTDDILWVGGDGSARRYRKLDATHWQAAAGGFRDTLVLDSVYTRTLRHGIKVVYDSAHGRHIRTVNRTGQKSTFSYSGTSDRLTSIQVPPAGVSGTSYSFSYDASNKLFRIADPANRNLDVTVTANRLRVITHQDAGVTRVCLRLDRHVPGAPQDPYLPSALHRPLHLSGQPDHAGFGTVRHPEQRVRGDGLCALGHQGMEYQVRRANGRGHGPGLHQGHGPSGRRGR